jgi:hypothetical protein
MRDYRIYRPDHSRTVGFFAIAYVHVAIGTFYMRFNTTLFLLIRI